MNGDGNKEFLNGFIQLLSDKKVTTLGSTALVPYPVRAIFPNRFARKKQRLIDNGLTLVRLLLVYFTQA